MSQPPPLPKKKRSGCFIALICVGLFAVVGFLAIGFVASMADMPDARSPKITKEPEETPSQETAPTESFIPGIAAVDVYGNLKDRGFTISQDYGKSMAFWKCEDSSNPQVTYRADVSARTASQILYVSGTVMNFGTNRTEDLAKPFLGFLATLPHKGSDPQAAKQWVESNISEIGASTQFGDVVYTISGNDRSRILQLRHMNTTP